MITIKELAFYLPYRLNVKMLNYKCDYVGNEIDTIIGLEQWDKSNSLWCCLTVGGSKPSLSDIKPILRPLSDLIKEIEVNGKKFVPAYRTQLHINDRYLPFTVNGRIVLENRIVTNTILYTDMQYLISLHFDVFGLIEKGLAIDINKLVK